MECPVCKSFMKKVRDYTTYNANNAEYDHSVYQCEKDDVWVTTEIPKKNSKK